jgi:hypothetical protein
VPERSGGVEVQKAWVDDRREAWIRRAGGEVRCGWSAGGGHHVPSLHSVADAPYDSFNVMKAVGRLILSVVLTHTIL